MKRNEFLARAAENAFFSNVDIDKEKMLKRTRKMTCINVNLDFMFDFLCRGGLKGYLMFSRFEKKSGDKLEIGIFANYDSICFWEDIGMYVCMVAYIRNCTCYIEKIYLSEDGRFWDEHHKLLFTTEEELFDHLITAEFDFHPVITDKTYEMMRHFGWYEGRRVDTSKLERELEKHDITLSQKQLDAISEFSGLTFEFSACSWNLEFDSIERMIDELSRNELNFRPEVYDVHSKRLIGKNVLEFGWYDMGYFSISEDGKIFFDGEDPRGRSTLEFIYAFEKDMPVNGRWL